MDICFNQHPFQDHHHPDSLVSVCRRGLPRECCGILTGRTGPGYVQVEGFQRLRNTAAVPETGFAFDPAEWVETLYRYSGSEEPLEMVGLFHSHPAAPALPSAADKETLWELPLHLIVSLQYSKMPILRCYLPRTGRSWEEQAIRFRNG